MNQTFISIIDLVISDNSTNDEVGHMMKLEFPEIKYIRRHPSLTSYEHSKTIISEVESEYYMIFHDDDIMLPNMVESLFHEIICDTSIAAVGSNALQYFNYHISKIQFLKCFLSPHNIIFDAPEPFYKKYLMRTGISPLSSYLYRSSVYNSSILNDSDFGRCGDVIFISKGFNSGKILWINNVLMIYRIHNTNDTHAITLNDRDSLIKYILYHSAISNTSPLLLLYLLHDYYDIVLLSIQNRSFFKNKRFKESLIYLLKNIHILILLKIPLIIYNKIMRFIDSHSYKLPYPEILNSLP